MYLRFTLAWTKRQVPSYFNPKLVLHQPILFSKKKIFKKYAMKSFTTIYGNGNGTFS